MEFIYDENLPSLKLYEDTPWKKGQRYFFLFEKDFEADSLQDKGHFVVGSIKIDTNEKRVCFSIRNHSLFGLPTNYQGKGYGTLVYHYVNNVILPALTDATSYTICIGESEEIYQEFKQHIEQKQGEAKEVKKELKNEQ